MLSYLYRLTVRFEKTHRVRPNLLYLHPDHLDQLRHSFDQPDNLGKILDLLQMELIVDREVIHPRVGWIPMVERRAG